MVLFWNRAYQIEKQMRSAWGPRRSCFWRGQHLFSVDSCHAVRTLQLKRTTLRRDWTRDELIVAFNLYCKIPFGRIHIRNPLVIELAKAIGRTPSAVSWKLANFSRLDPVLRKRHIVGASHGAKSEIEIWNEFRSDWERLAFESERLLAQITGHVLDPKEVDDFR